MKKIEEIRHMSLMAESTYQNQIDSIEKEIIAAATAGFGQILTKKFKPELLERMKGDLTINGYSWSMINGYLKIEWGN